VVKKNILWFLVGMMVWLMSFSPLLSNYLLDSNLAFNGTIRTIVHNEGINYVGGTFTKISYLTGSAVIVDNTDGEFAAGFPKVNGKVNVIIPDGQGGWFIGGEFTRVGGLVRNRIAQINASGFVTSFAPNVNIGRYPYIYDMVLHQGKLYVSGSFQGINDDFRSYVACLDLNGNLTPWKPKVDDEVYSIAIAGDTIYLGGNFRYINDTKRDFAGAVSINDASLASWNPEANNFVRSIEINSDKIYLGGAFTRLKGETINRLGIVKINGLLESWYPNVNNVVESISIKNSRIYIGGRFTRVNNLNRLYLASFDLSGTLQNWTPSADGNVFFVDFFNDKLYVAGAFNKINGQDRAGFAAINNDATLDSWNPSSNGTGLAVSAIGDDIFVGGNFTGLGGVKRNYLAAIDSEGNFTSWNPNPNAEINGISIMNNRVYVAGNFTNISGQARKYLAAIKLDGSLEPFAINPSSFIYAVKAKDNKIVIGGNFSKINNIDRKYLAMLDTNANLLPWTPSPNASVYCLDMSDSHVYIGGFFTMVNAAQRNRAASVDFSGTLTEFNPDANNAVLSIAYYKERVYLGGWFSSVGGQPRSRLAAFNLDGTLNSWNPSPDNTIWTIYGYSEPFDMIYIGGDFTKLSGQDFLNLAAVDLFGNILPWTPNPDRPVYALAGSPDAMYSGGEFRSLDNALSPNFASLSYYSPIPENVILLTPEDDAVNQPLTNTFTWEPTLFASHYQIQISSDGDFLLPPLIDVHVNNTFFNLTDSLLEYSSHYYWRVRAKNTNKTGVWSEIYTFMTQIPPPEAPELIEPEDQETDIDLSPIFVWSESIGATSYELVISEQSDFSSFVVSITNIADTTFFLGGNLLAPLTEYFWKVRAINFGGPGLWSDPYSFTTKEYIIHDLVLSAGWNMISTYVIPTEPDIEVIFDVVKDDIEIVKDNFGNVYIPAFDINMIGDWNYKEGYSVYTKKAMNFELIGLPVNPSDHPIDLNSGWNMIAYLRNNPLDIELALGTLVDDGILVIAKDNLGNVYLPAFEINTIGDMIPGQGYQIYILNGGTLIYPEN